MTWAAIFQTAPNEQALPDFATTNGQRRCRSEANWLGAGGGMRSAGPGHTIRTTYQAGGVASGQLQNPRLITDGFGRRSYRMYPEVMMSISITLARTRTLWRLLLSGRRSLNNNPTRCSGQWTWGSRARVWHGTLPKRRISSPVIACTMSVSNHASTTVV